ncbi:MAG: MFS transporter [Candidatus Acidiferrales bacterium]
MSAGPISFEDGPAGKRAAAPAGASPTWERWKVLAWLCCLSVFTYIGRIGISSQIRENIEFDLHLVPSLTAYAISAFTLSYALFELPSGWLGDRFGPRKVLTRVVLCWMVFTALTGASWSLASLVFFRFMIGAGEAGAFPNIARATREWFPFRERGLAQGYVWMLARFGGAIAFPFLLALTHVFGWRWTFVVTGAIGVVWVSMFWARFRDTPAQDPKVNEAERALIAEGQRETKKPAPLSWRNLLLSPTIWFLLLMYFCSNAGWAFFSSWITPYLEGDLHLRGMKLAFASALPWVFAGFACFLGGFLTDRMVRRWGRRWGRTLIGAIGYGVAAAMMVLAHQISTHHAAWAFGAICFSSFAKDLGMAATWAITIDIGHRYSGSVSGLMNSLGNVGQVLSPLVVVQLAILFGTRAHPNWNVSLPYNAATFFIAAVCFVFVDPRRTVVYSDADRQRLEAEGMLNR